VESGKWVGPVKSPLTGEIVSRNDAAEADATILNRSPYNEGWIVRLAPVDWDGERAALVTGEQASEGFAAYMAEKELSECIHCEGFEA
jgi:glycine cleavage system H protein